jgi:copper chaperone NosL
MAWLGVVVTAACASPPAGPPVVQWGIDECSHCHMIVGEARFAAASRGPAGEEARFDDLGCLVAWAATAPAGWQVWVHDAAGEGWLDATSAAYLHVPGRATPMASGLSAHVDAAAAALVASAAGAPEAKILGWRDLGPFLAGESQRRAVAGR